MKGGADLSESLMIILNQTCIKDLQVGDRILDTGRDIWEVKNVLTEKSDPTPVIIMIELLNVPSKKDKTCLFITSSGLVINFEENLKYKKRFFSKT